MNLRSSNRFESFVFQVLDLDTREQLQMKIIPNSGYSVSFEAFPITGPPCEEREDPHFLSIHTFRLEV